MLVQQIISIEENVLFSIVEAHLYLTALLDQFLYNWLPKTLELNVEVKLEIFQRFRRDQNVFQRSIYFRFDLPEILDDFKTVLFFVFSMK